MAVLSDVYVNVWITLASIGVCVGKLAGGLYRH